jgi:hypothetical protein
MLYKLQNIPVQTSRIPRLFTSRFSQGFRKLFFGGFSGISGDVFWRILGNIER